MINRWKNAAKSVFSNELTDAKLLELKQFLIRRGRRRLISLYFPKHMEQMYEMLKAITMGRLHKKDNQEQEVVTAMKQRKSNKKRMIDA
jgi:hypothetical protein